MALINDLKKLLFGAKAVTKSATEKAVEAGEDLTGAGSELLDKAKNKVEGVGKTVLDKTEDLAEKAGGIAEEIGGKILQAAAVAKSKAQDFTEDLKQKAEEADDLTDEFVADVKDRADDTLAQVKRTAENADDIMDDIIADARSAKTGSEVGDTLDLPPLKASTTPDFTTAQKDASSDEVWDAVLKEDNLADKASDFVEGVGKKVLDTGSGLAEKIGEKAEKIGGSILGGSDKILDKAADFTEGVGKRVLDTGSNLAEKFGEKAEGIGETLFEKGGEALEKAKDMATGIGSKILKAKDDLIARAEEEAARSGESAETLTEKLKNLNQKLEDKISGNNQPFADKPLDTGGSEFKKHDSFWDKADKFAKGDYHGTSQQPKPGEISIQQDPNYTAPEKGKVKGFEDLDGDGDELIDDAIIDDDK